MNGEYSTAVLIGRKEFVEENPELVKKFISAHIEATEFIINNQLEAEEIINTSIEKITGQKLEKEVMSSVFNRLEFSFDPMQKSIIEFMRIAKKENFITTIASTDSLLKLDILNSVLKENGYPTIK